MGRRAKNRISPIYIGTSGYSYRHWANGVFYPEGLSQNRWLEYYTGHFRTAELNVTFYRQPKASVFQGWAKRTPPEFLFTLKGSRFITHIKRLMDCEEPLQRFFETAAPLGEKLKLVLWQLPPSFQRDEHLLERFCQSLTKISPDKTGHVFEFRNATWFCEETYEILERFGFHLCVADSPRYPSEERVISRLGYLRFHGAETMYGYLYSRNQLEEWARKIQDWAREAEAFFVYFNNDIGGHAPRNAKELKELLAPNAI